MVQPAPDEISIEINGTAFRYWSEVELTRVFDGHSSVAFSAPFEAEHREFRDLFRPFSFADVEVLVGGKKLFSGTMVDVAPQVSAESRSVSVTAYSKAAVLADVSMPASSFPLEFNGLTLKQISEKVIQPFGLSLAPNTPKDGAPFERVALEPSSKVQDFLADLAKQRGLVLASDQEGRLEYRQSNPGTPVAKLRDDSSPVTGVSVSFSPQEFFSEVTGIAKAKGGRSGSKYTEKNPFLSDSVRPSNFELSDTEPGDLPGATTSKLGRMLGNVVTYEVGLNTWFTPKGDLWEPDQVISLLAPGAMAYRATDLSVRVAKLLAASDQSKTASLSCVLPGAFSGVMPSTLPWLES